MKHRTKDDTRLSYEHAEWLYDNITNHICQLLNLDKQLLFAKTRLWSVVKVRHTLVHLLYMKYRNRKYIARYLNKDRTTVCHSLDVVSNLWNTDKVYRDYLQQLKQYVYEKNNKRTSQET
jgi:chromosomal replication initiation ATPase DnaA